jgi:hypothetical protein
MPIVIKPYVVTLFLRSGQSVDVVIQAASVEAAERELRLTFQEGKQLRFTQADSGELVVVYDVADVAGVRIRPLEETTPALPPG